MSSWGPFCLHLAETAHYMPVTLSSLSASNVSVFSVLQVTVSWRVRCGNHMGVFQNSQAQVPWTYCPFFPRMEYRFMQVEKFPQWCTALTKAIAQLLLLQQGPLDHCHSFSSHCCAKIEKRLRCLFRLTVEGCSPSWRELRWQELESPVTSHPHSGNREWRMHAVTQLVSPHTQCRAHCTENGPLTSNLIYPCQFL